MLQLLYSKLCVWLVLVVYRGKPQFSIGLNPGRQAIELSILNFNGELQTLSWEKPEEQTHNTSVPTMLHFSFFKSFHLKMFFN